MGYVEECDRYGFFNGILGLEQANWANYWRGIIPDGVISGQGQEMEVYAQSDGMKVHVRTGSAIIDNHRAWVTKEKEVLLAPATGSARNDLVVLRVTYGNSGESKIELTAKTGDTSLVTVTGGVYEVPLAKVYVSANAVTITAGNVTDMRYVYKLGNDSVTTFSGTSLSCKNDIEYRASTTALSSLQITLPQNPNDTFITGVCFTSASSFGGITFRKGSTGITPKLVGDSTSLPNKRYNMVIWWDSGCQQYWSAVKAI